MAAQAKQSYRPCSRVSRTCCVLLCSLVYDKDTKQTLNQNIYQFLQCQNPVMTFLTTIYTLTAFYWNMPFYILLNTRYHYHCQIFNTTSYPTNTYLCTPNIYYKVLQTSGCESGRLLLRNMPLFPSLPSLLHLCKTLLPNFHIDRWILSGSCFQRRPRYNTRQI